MLTIGYVILGLAVVEIAGSAIVWAADRLGIRIPERKRFFRLQSEMLPRLLEATRVTRIHPDFGWIYIANFESVEHNMNSAAMRSLREYAPEVPPGIRRVAAYGDSFVFCNEVLDPECWPASIETTWNAEVLNFGVGGYGADQALMRYRAEGAAFKHDVAILGITAMMAPRVVSRYRRFQEMADGPWFKPRLFLQGDRLESVPAPLKSIADLERFLATPEATLEFGKGDTWYESAVFESPLYRFSRAYRLVHFAISRLYRRYWWRDAIFRQSRLNPESEAFRLLERLVQEFAETACARGAEIAVLMLPSRADIELYREMKQSSYDPLIDRVKAMGINVIDVAPAISESGKPLDELFAKGGHFTPAGNTIVAGVVAEALALQPRAPLVGRLA
jgi:hypothetical protein